MKIEDVKVGMNVTWVHESRRGRTFSCFTKRGTVKSVENGIAWIMGPSGKGRGYHVSVSELHSNEQDTQREMMGIVDGVRKLAGGR